MAALEYNAVITQKTEVAPGLCIFHIAPIGWDLPPLKAGQFVAVGLKGSESRYEFADAEYEPADPDKMIRRAYSVASGSVDTDHVELYVSLVKSGALTPRLFNLKTGDKLFMNKKFTGMFTLDQVEDDKNIILIATGTGVAPYMSMLRSSIKNHETRKYAVVHGSYNSWDLGYRSELRTVERFSPNFSYIPTISHPENEPIEWKGNVGFVQSILENRVLQEKWGTEITPENTSVFLCGHPKMIEDVVELLAKDGFTVHSKKDPGPIHTEKF